jgi:hypothetical protein
MEDQMQAVLDGYLLLMEQFVSGVMQASEFEQAYLAYRRTVIQQVFPEEVHISLSKVFSAVDAYCDDPRLADYSETNPWRDISSTELKTVVLNEFQRLRSFEGFSDMKG